MITNCTLPFNYKTQSRTSTLLGYDGQPCPHPYTQFDHVTFPVFIDTPIEVLALSWTLFLSPLTYETVVETSQAEMSRSGALVVVVFLSSLLGKAFSFVT